MSAAGARLRYHGCLDEQKRLKERQVIDLKRKGLIDEQDDLKKKRARVGVLLKNQLRNMQRRQMLQANRLASQNPSVSDALQKRRHLLEIATSFSLICFSMKN